MISIYCFALVVLCLLPMFRAEEESIWKCLKHVEVGVGDGYVRCLPSALESEHSCPMSYVEIQMLSVILSHGMVYRVNLTSATGWISQ